ncbi:LuxR C-terminal-related transcriptional regulator [Micromonosporaceae bacterium Da 78-11]
MKDALSSPVLIGRALRCHLDATLGSVFLFAGRIDEGEQFNDRHYMTAHLGHVRWATGDRAGAETAARRALADGGSITTRITALHVVGFVALGRGDPAGAVAALTEAESLGSGMRELQRVSPAWWGLAEVALRAGDQAAAVERCEQGYAASARVRDAAYLFPYVVTGTRAHLAGSGATAARDWLARTSEPADAAAFAAAARTAYAGVDAPVPSNSPSAAVSVPPVLTVLPVLPILSAREVEVARLVAAGLTNREIAAALTIAPKTAAAHVEHIRTELGFSRRTQIAAWVATRS